jgi:DNA-binding transcriptional LysR family regulator
MDIELARTFLEIAAAGSFAAAAERLNVTQTTVSARVRNLEDQLGRRLFVRNKAGARLTPAGEQFQRHAATLIQVWERARHQVAVPEGRRAALSIGCEPALWNPLLLDWLLWMRGHAPEIAWRAQIGLADDLSARIAAGVLDLAILYAPRYQSGLKVELLNEDKLVLVTTAPGGAAPASNDYVYVDWGPEFAARHNMSFPEWINPGAHVGLGPLGLGYILAGGGAGYFRRRLVQPHLDGGRLHLVPGAPEFSYPVYAIYAEQGDPALVGIALEGLRASAAGVHDAGAGPGPPA